MTTKAKKILISVAMVAAFALSHVNTDAQITELSVKNRWNIKGGYSWYLKQSYSIKKTPHLRVEVNYGFLNCLEAGVYGGVYIDDVYYATEIYDDGSSSGYGKTRFFPVYGINANFHPLPLLVKEKKFWMNWFDVYITAKAGARTATRYSGRGSTIMTTGEYGLGAGASLYIGNIGIYAEYSLGKYSPSDWSDYIAKQKSSLRYGITFRF